MTSSASCKLCPIYSRCVTGNFRATHVECADCGRKGVQLRRKDATRKDCDDSIYRFAPCLRTDQAPEKVTCRACRALQRHRMFA